jgi:NAD dependent epimerase/dehydratase family enzyme
MEYRLFTSTSFQSSSSMERFQTSRWTTSKICKMYCEERAAAGHPLKAYVQGSSYLYYHTNEETEDNIWTEKDEGGWTEPINQWVRIWENNSRFEKEIETRHVILRTGNVLATDDGLLRYFISKTLRQ